MKRSEVVGFVVLMLSALIVLILILGAFWAFPQYNVYRQRMGGEAVLREAESSRQVAIEEARAKLESAKLLSDAEIERARGVAEANKIIGDSLKDNEAYLRYLWIDGLQSGKASVIYVPTEANLPILEAGKR